MQSDQFDATLGGEIHLPFSANSLKLAAARSIEIAAMSESILRPSRTKLIFQTLPVHMRRRVMSHNCKRLPRKLRQGHMEQLKKSGLPPKQKRPSRKHRRRASNLVFEYARRQNKAKWLESHIWHAKRFHMVDRWGYKIPESPCDKAFRACYRASSAHCLMQDISFHSCIILNGNFEKICNFFEALTSPHVGLSIKAKAYLNGHREGTAYLYQPNSYPLNHIGNITFFWEPNKSENKSLWLFIHASQYEEVAKVLLQVANNSELCNGSEDVYMVPTKKRKLSACDPNLECGKCDFGEINITFQKDTFNRFRLTGPNSQAVLRKTLCCLKYQNIENNEWVKEFQIKNGKHLDLDKKAEYWNIVKNVSSPSQLPQRLVIGLIVKDPRLCRPSLRTKATNILVEPVPTSLLIGVPDYAPTSPLWNVDLQKIIKAMKMSNTEMIRRATDKQLVPGEIYDDPDVQSVPVLLVQRPGSQDNKVKKIGYGSGWDIIIPSGYSLPFWHTFIMHGARAGGLRETESICFESGSCYLPPDTQAGKKEEERIEDKLRDRYFKLPPNKRVNYMKYGIKSPFRCLWLALVKEWSLELKDIYVLRDKIKLEALQDCIEKKQGPNFEVVPGCLIPVYIQLVGKGNLKRHALVSMPIRDDISSVSVLFEPAHKDPNIKLRKELKSKHRVQLKSKRRKQIRLKQKGLKSSQVRKKNQTGVSEYVKQMRELWLPSTVGNIRNACSRETMGFVSQGAFSFTEAKPCGVAYVAYEAMRILLLNGFNRVLVRNTTSRKYRLANISVIKP